MLSSATGSPSGRRFPRLSGQYDPPGLPWVIRRSPLPWLHIAEVVAAQAAERGFRRLGIIGTRYLVDGEVYPEKLTARGLGYLRPNTAERAEINRIIFEELVAGVSDPKQSLLPAGHGRMKDEGCDAVGWAARRSR